MLIAAFEGSGNRHSMCRIITLNHLNDDSSDEDIEVFPFEWLKIDKTAEEKEELKLEVS